MKKYRKKPIVVEAVQWTTDNMKEISELTNQRCGVLYPFAGMTGKVKAIGDCGQCGSPLGHNHLWIGEPEEDHVVCPGDFIIEGVRGENYPVKPDIFAETYEEVEE